MAEASDPRSEAAALWRRKANKAFDEIRRALREMASGLERCMYCEDGAGTDIEHFYPRASYPEHTFEWLNYLLACSACNSNYKRNEFPLDAEGAPLLIDPSAEEPLEHLSLSPSTGEFRAKTPKGSESIRVFGLQRSILVEGRRDAWVTLQALLLLYAKRRREGSPGSEKLETAVRQFPFAGVLVFLVSIAQGPAAADLVEPECLTALDEFPEILSWA